MTLAEMFDRMSNRELTLRLALDEVQHHERDIEQRRQAMR